MSRNPTDVQSSHRTARHRQLAPGGRGEAGVGRAGAVWGGLKEERLYRKI